MDKYDCIINEGETIFRYDLVEPPVNWDINYKSIEYSSKRFGKIKNFANNFFFFSNEDVTRKTASVAIKSQSEKLCGYWLTKAVILRNLRLLCLCGDNILYNLLKLYELELDVFTDNFMYYSDNEYKSFSILKNIFNEWVKCDVFDLERKIELGNTLIHTFRKSSYPFGILGQTLTDFENGVFFTKLLIEKGYDGYVFDESVGGHSICLFCNIIMKNPSALSAPIQKKILIDK